MKQLLLFVLLLGFFPAYAEENSKEFPAEEIPPEVYWAQKPIQCGTFASIVELVREYGEEPLLSAEGLSLGSKGEAINVTIIIGGNEETMTWTLIEVQDNSATACVLGSGSGFKIYKLPANKVMTRG